MNQHNETELLHGAQELNAGILMEIFDLYRPGIFAYAYRLLGEANAAEDCVAETFARFLKSLQSGGGPTNHLKSYLYRIAHNWITDRFRREPMPMLELNENLTCQLDDRMEILVENKGEINELRFALRQLTEDQRMVITLRYIEGWETDQVAAAMNRPSGAIKALQHRALAALRKLLSSIEVTDEFST